MRLFLTTVARAHARVPTSPSSFPDRLTGLPATSTVSTRPGWAAYTTWPTGLFTGVRVSESPRSAMMSACLPGVRLPILWSRPQARAPSIVANDSTSRDVRETAGRSLAPGSWLSRARWQATVTRMVPHRCPPLDTQVSMERLGLIQARSSRPVAGHPCPICISMSGAMDTVPPDPAIRVSSSSASVLQCT